MLQAAALGLYRMLKSSVLRVVAAILNPVRI